MVLSSKTKRYHCRSRYLKFQLTITLFLSDISERKQAEDIHIARTRLILFANNHSSDELLEETLNEVERFTNSLIGFYHFVAPDQNALTLQNWSTRTKKEYCKAEGKGSHYEIARAGVWVDCLLQRKPVIHNDYASLPHKKGLPPGHSIVVRELVVPVMRGDRIMAIMGVGNKPGNYDEQDIKTVSLFADLVWDITEHKLAEEEIKKLNDELKIKVKNLIEAQEELVRKEKLSTLGLLAGSVGHELRNPLGVMSNAVYYLKSVMSGEDKTVKEYLDMIKGEIDNSQRIISDLLDFSRTKVPQARSITVRDLISQSLGKCLISGGVSLDVDIPDDLPGVKVDPFQMGQVFQNLITNGIQAMPNGGSLRVSARLSAPDRIIRGQAACGVHPALAPGTRDAGHRRNAEYLPQPSPQGGEEDIHSELATPNSALHGNFIEVSVTDTGEGISPENMKKLFQPLFTTKARGIGLGLIVSKNLTEANGGRLEAESQIGKGTTFTVILPVLMDEKGRG